MKEYEKNFMKEPIIIIVMFLMWVLGMVMGNLLASDKIDNFYHDAAQTECAQFNPETGDFEWIDDIERMIKEGFDK